MSVEEDSSTSAVEIHVLTVKECFIYKVPPLKSASGHRAEEWGLDKPLFTGYLQIFQADLKLRIALYSYKDQSRLIMDPDNIIPFGQCPIEIKPGESITNFVDGVIDSSRYYVVRLKDPNSSRWIWIGVGFREREIAFDFKTALNEYVKYIDRSALASKLASVDNLVDDNDNGEEDDETRARKRDHLANQNEKLLQLEQHIEPLKDGEKIKVNFKSTNKSHHHQTSGSKGTGTFGGLKPPPQPGATVFGSIIPPPSTNDVVDTPVTAAVAAPAEDDDWGDFVST